MIHGFQTIFISNASIGERESGFPAEKLDARK